ncbi:dUTP diphosphatase [Virgibacillus sp. FSP13]
MNLNILFKPQAELDKHIEEEHNLQGQNLLKKKTVALLTELFECVNEARFFKFWSRDQKPRKEDWYPVSNDVGVQWKNPLLEEYVDIIHFALSIANDLGYHEHKYVDPGGYDLNDLTIGLANLITLLPETKYHRHIEVVFNYLIKLGYSLGFDEKDVTQAYFEKNKTNHKRQANGY